MKKNIFVVIMFVLLFKTILPYSVVLKREFKLKTASDSFIQLPSSFFITEDNLIFVFDVKAGNIKIFKITGEYITKFGRKGMGPNEFIFPAYGVYKKPFVTIMDFGKRRVFVYKRIGKTGLKAYKSILSLYLAEDIAAMEGGMLVAGYTKNKKGYEYNLYFQRYKDESKVYLLPWGFSYGDYKNKGFMKIFSDKISRLSLNAYCDYDGEEIYYVWDADLRIIKINKKTNKVKVFGHKTDNYKQPVLTPELIRAHREKGGKNWRDISRHYSHLRKIFSNKDLVGILIVGNYRANKISDIFIQLYKPSGEFIGEKLLKLTKVEDMFNELRFHFNKDKNLLYILETITDEEFEQSFKMFEYKITL